MALAAPHTAVAVALLLCCGLPLQAQGLRLEQGFAPDFVACDTPEPCGLGDVPSQYMQDLLAYAREAADRRLERGGTPTLLHIGAEPLSKGANFTGWDLYSKLLSNVSKAVNASLKMVLIEANSRLVMALNKTAAALPMASKNITIVNGLVLRSCDGNSSKTMYRFSKQPSLDFGAPFSIYGPWLSRDKSFPVGALRWMVRNNATLKLPAGVQTSLLNFFEAPNVSSYVEEVQVPCFTPASLLNATETLASDLAMVIIKPRGVVDEGGFVDEFVHMPGFRPGFLQWDGDFPDMISNGLELQAKKFKIGNALGGGNFTRSSKTRMAVAMD